MKTQIGVRFPESTHLGGCSGGPDKGFEVRGTQLCILALQVSSNPRKHLLFSSVSTSTSLSGSDACEDKTQGCLEGP